MCKNASQMVACIHVMAGQPADVILCDDDGTIDTAACKSCADKIDAVPEEISYADTEVDELVGAFCFDCFKRTTGLESMPAGGFWLRNADGTYRPQLEN
jgi:hypothetical protein